MLKINITSDVADSVTFSDRRPDILRELNKGLSVEFHSATHKRISWHGCAKVTVNTTLTQPMNELVKSKVKIISERKHPILNQTVVTHVCKDVTANTLEAIEAMYTTEIALQNGELIKTDRYAELKKQRDLIDQELEAMNKLLRQNETNPIQFRQKLSGRRGQMSTADWETYLQRQADGKKLAKEREAELEAA